MFEILGVVNFRYKSEIHLKNHPLSRCDYYEGFKFRDYAYSSSISRIYFFERTDTCENSFVNEKIQVFLYGTCFSNRYYEQKYLKPSAKLTAAELYDLFCEHNERLTDYVKGMFSIVIIDLSAKAIMLISDRTNLLPLYYSFQNNVFVFSSSLNALLMNGLVKKNINAKALAKLGIFGYVPSNETMIKNVFMQSYASRIKVAKDELTEERYWDITEAITEPANRLNRSEALQECNNLMVQNVDTYVADHNYFALTFTGGYDSRAICSTLQRDKKDYFCYSYGIDGSYDIRIPREICHELGVNYKGLLLNERFEADFDRYALQSIYFSDGLGAVTQANLIYACERIVDSTEVVLTGLFGSELIKQPTSLGYYIDANVRELFFNKSPHTKYNSIVEYEKNKGYINKEIIDEYKEDIYATLSEDYLSEKLDRYKFYFFVFREGIRKYFMRQLKMERFYVESRHPFLDDDFVTLIFKTPFAGIYNIRKNKSIFNAWEPHLLYAYIISKNNPKLARYMTTHGYRPADLLSYSKMSKALWDYFRNRDTIRKTNTFNYSKWLRSFCMRHIHELDHYSGFFGRSVVGSFVSGHYIENLEKFSRFLSLNFWLQYHGL